MDVSKQIWLIHMKDNTIHWLDIESARQLLAGEFAISLIDTYHKCIIGNWYCLRGQNDSSIRQFTAAFRPELLPVLENMMIITIGLHCVTLVTIFHRIVVQAARPYIMVILPYHVAIIMPKCALFVE